MSWIGERLHQIHSNFSVDVTVTPFETEQQMPLLLGLFHCPCGQLPGGAKCDLPPSDKSWPQEAHFTNIVSHVLAESDQHDRNEEHVQHIGSLVPSGSSFSHILTLQESLQSISVSKGLLVIYPLRNKAWVTDL